MAANINHEADFITVLTHLGFAPGVIQTINDNGFNTTADLIGVDEKDVENLLKIIRSSTTPPTLVPYMAQKRLNTLCYWVNRRHRLQESIHARDFTPEALEAFTQLLTLDKQEEDTSPVKPPPEFKAGSKWKSFKEGAITTLIQFVPKDRSL